MLQQVDMSDLDDDKIIMFQKKCVSNFALDFIFIDIDVDFVDVLLIFVFSFSFI